MSFLGTLFGNQEKRRRERRQHDLDTNYYKRQKIYNEELEKQREENAKRKAIIDANQIANQKPFYQKVMGLAVTVGKDLAEGAGKTDPSVFFNWDEQPKRKKRRR